MHLCNDIKTFVDEEKWTINMVVDIPKWSNNKYEYDEEWWYFKLDRVIHHSMYYPCDYGFAPQTLSEDWDPCDVFLLVTNPTFPGCVIEVRPIWILYTTDDAGDDPKIIAVPSSSVDPRREEIRHIDDLWAHRKKELLSFFKEIKLLEHNKYDKIDVRGFGSVQEAKEEIIKSVERFNEHMKK